MEPAVEIAKAQTEYMWELGRKFARQFEWDNIRFTEMLVAAGGTRGLLVWIYCLLRNYKKIVALEDLSKEDKDQMWGLAMDVCQGEHRTRKKMHEIVMAFYALEYFLNEKR